MANKAKTRDAVGGEVKIITEGDADFELELQSLFSALIGGENHRELISKFAIKRARQVSRDCQKSLIRWEGEKGHCPKFKTVDGELVPDLSHLSGGEFRETDHVVGLYRLFKTHRLDAIQFLVDATLRSTKDSAGSDSTARVLNGMLAVIDSIDPQDSVEGMLAAQMVATHSAALDMIGYANRAKTAELTDAYLKNATKLMDQYTKQLSALDKHRKGGKQTVVVKHVHVHEGGQAVIDSNIQTASSVKPDGGSSAK